MGSPLPGKLRAQWDECIATEGTRIGLSECNAFLENKLVNDVFYIGFFKGRRCIVKCSSRAPDSLENEYRISGRMYGVDSRVCAEPLAFWKSGDGKRAFVVFAGITGPSLAELMKTDMAADRADGFADDILHLAIALGRGDVIHRDLSEDNLLLDEDGHLKAIDFQFALCRTGGREDAWMRRHWKYRYVVFGVNRDLGHGVWNDFYALERVVAAFPQTEKVKSVRQWLSEQAPAMTVSMAPGWSDRLRLRVYAWSLRGQMLLRGRAHRKYPQLERRWRMASGGNGVC